MLPPLLLVCCSRTTNCLPTEPSNASYTANMPPRKRSYAQAYPDYAYDYFVADPLPAVPPARYAYGAPGSSSNPIVLDEPTPPKPKKQRRKVAAGTSAGPAPEKRGAIMKKKCPQNILERLERVREQRYVLRVVLSPYICR